MPKLEMASAPLSPRGRDQKPRNPSSDLIAQIVLQTYKGNLKYSQNQNCFFIYEHKSKGLWSSLSDIEMKGEVKHRLDLVKDHLLPSGYSMNLVNDVVEQLRISEIFDEWYEDNKHLLFKMESSLSKQKNCCHSTGNALYPATALQLRTGINL